MPTTFANTISLDGGVTNLPIYADRAEKDAAGNDISTTYATKSELPASGELVPAATSADEDKVLTVDAQGIPGWALVPAQSTGLFQAVYDTTSYADIVQAINDKKIVYCRLNSGASRMAFLAYIGSSNVEFQYYRSLSSHSAANMTDEVYVYTVSSSGWTTTTRKTGAKVVAGTHMSQSYSNDTLTLNCTWPTVDQTYDASSADAQSGVAVASGISDAIATLPANLTSTQVQSLKETLGVDETVLYNGALPAFNDTITLAEQLSNFEYIDVSYNTTENPYVTRYPTALLNASRIAFKIGWGVNYMLDTWLKFTPTNDPKVWTYANNTLMLLTNTGTSLSITQNDTTYITTSRTIRIVGVHRIASN